jgi:hypothetical protein
MALQAECEILNHPDDLSNAGPVPDELGVYTDGVAAASIPRHPEGRRARA